MQSRSPHRNLIAHVRYRTCESAKYNRHRRGERRIAAGAGAVRFSIRRRVAIGQPIGDS